MVANTRTITLDTKTKRRIVEMVAVSRVVLAQRNYKLRLVATIFYGLTIGAGYLLATGVIKSGWFALATPLLGLVLTCWAIAHWVAKVQTSKPLKIRIK